tara:strand:+ start:5528 stop:5854 length:327 start_codon:yes stop_codon:yes gene_type:complete
MNKFLLIFALFAMVSSTTVSVAHACMDIETSIETSHTQDDDFSDKDESPVKSHDYEMACGNCSLHHSVYNNASSVDSLIPTVFAKPFPVESDIVLSKMAYSLKRPPKA